MDYLQHYDIAFLIIHLFVLYFYRSERQARLEQEQNDMMEKISKIRKTDFDNTRRIERPEEILEVSFTVDFLYMQGKMNFELLSSNKVLISPLAIQCIT